MEIEIGVKELRDIFTKDLLGGIISKEEKGIVDFLNEFHESIKEFKVVITINHLDEVIEKGKLKAIEAGEEPEVVEEAFKKLIIHTFSPVFYSILMSLDLGNKACIKDISNEIIEAGINNITGMLLNLVLSNIIKEGGVSEAFKSFIDRKGEEEISLS